MTKPNDDELREAIVRIYNNMDKVCDGENCGAIVGALALMLCKQVVLNEDSTGVTVDKTAAMMAGMAEKHLELFREQRRLNKDGGRPEEESPEALVERLIREAGANTRH